MGFWSIAGPLIGSIGSGLLGLDAQTEAAEIAAEAQTASTQAQIAEAKRQFDAQMQQYRSEQARLQQMQDQQIRQLSPYIQGGQSALYEMMAISGLSAPQVSDVTASDVASAYKDRTGVIPQYEYTNNPISYDFSSNPLGDPGFGATQASSGLSQSQTQYDTQRIPDINGPGLTYGYRDVDSLYGQPLEQGVGPVSGMLGTVANVIGNTVLQPAIDESQQYTNLIEQRTVPSVTSPYAGMTGEEAQNAAIQKISDSPLLAELVAQGEEALLQQASATGGLRGGNTQGALAQYRPQMLQNEIDRQYARLQGISNTGQQSILGSPTATTSTGYPSGSSITSLLGDIGSINAAEALASGSATSDFWSGMSELFGNMYGNYSSDGSDSGGYSWNDINWETQDDSGIGA